MAKSVAVFPNEKELAAMRVRLSRSKASYVLPPDASAVDRAKHEVCAKILRYMRKERLTQRQLAAKIGIPETRVSEVVHYHIGKFTLDRLVGYLEQVHPRVTVRVA